MVRGCLPFYWATASSQPHHSGQLWWSFKFTCAILAIYWYDWPLLALIAGSFTHTKKTCWIIVKSPLTVLKKSLEIFCWGHKVKVFGFFLYTFHHTASSHLTDQCSYQLPTKNCASNILEINSIQKEKNWFRYDLRYYWNLNVFCMKCASFSLTT